MQPLAIVTLLGGALLLASCDAGTSETVASLEERVAALERRHARPGAEAGESSGEGDSAAVVARLDADLRSLERRLAEVEADVALLRDTAPEGGLDGEADEVRRERRSERRDRMRELTATYRERLAEVRRRYRDDPADPERHRALREVVEWYRSERRTLMRSE